MLVTKSKHINTTDKIHTVFVNGVYGSICGIIRTQMLGNIKVTTLNEKHGAGDSILHIFSKAVSVKIPSD